MPRAPRSQLADASPRGTPASIDADDTRRRGARVGGRRRNDPGFGWESLTAAEFRVAEAVATGLTAAQAAQRLFVSVHGRLPPAADLPQARHQVQGPPRRVPERGLSSLRHRLVPCSGDVGQSALVEPLATR